ncbi:hypothetical protein RclHR1_06200002 [Rhizophagus clarus]|uniref:Vacuolar ATPase assembly protein VMA22 n=1 Tax=Rhizophagus clarus TaxID=94130 RepID=A0A2Z6SHS2_9GLOM|nr:hypothetical protein RclHR1_06200002 [Rhizophagus clarus]
MEEICTKLDEALLEYLSLISKYQENWQQISKELEGAFMQLAHTKYTMGPGRLTQDQYDGRMQAATRILISQNLGVEEEEKHYNHQFSLINGHLENDENINESESSQSIDNSSILRRRNVKELETKTDNTNKTKKPQKKQIIRDPLHWFGLLVPPSLRDSQKHFKQGLVNMVNLLNIRNEILEKEAQYRILKQEKEKFMQELSKSKEPVNEEKNTQENVS